MNPVDPFELEVREAFRRHGVALDGLVPEPVLRRPIAPAGLVRAPVRLRASSRALPGMALALLLILVVVAAVLHPSFFGRVASTPSPSPLPAQWTGLDWGAAVTDGVELPPAHLPASAAWHERFVMATPTGLAASSDGAVWAASLAFPGRSNSGLVVASSRGFVAFDRYADSEGPDATRRIAVWRSDDGRSWRQGDASAFPEQSFVDSAASGGAGTVAIGMIGTPGTSLLRDPNARFALWFSPDDLSWREIPLNGLGGAQGRIGTTSVTAVPGGFLLSGTADGTTALWRSNNGTDWTRVSIDGLEPITPVFGVGARGVIAIQSGQSGTMAVADRGWTSADGTTWKPATGADLPQTVTSDGTRIVGYWPSVSEGFDSAGRTARTMISFDGVHWTGFAADGPDGNPATIAALSPDAALVDTGTRLYVVPATTRPIQPAPSPTVSAPHVSVATPPWSSVSIQGDPLLDVTPFVAAACDAGSLAATSTYVEGAPGGMRAEFVYTLNGGPARRTDSSLFDGVRITAIGCSDGGFLVAGNRLGSDGEAGDAVVWATRDGNDWWGLTTDSFPANTVITRLAGRSGSYLALTDGGAVWRSKGAASWEQVPMNLGSGTITSLAANAGGFVIGIYDSKEGSVTTRYIGDGDSQVTSWPAEKGATPSGQGAVFALGSGFVLFVNGPAVPSGNSHLVFTSPDGKTWAGLGARPSGVDPVASTGSLLIGVDAAAPGRLWQSLDGVNWQQLQVSGDVPSGATVAGANGAGILLGTGDALLFLPAAGAVAANPSSTSATSPGAAWRSLEFASRTTSGELPWAFSWPQGLLAGDGNFAEAAVSSNGTEWGDVTLPARRPLLAWTGSRLVAVASKGDGAALVWASPDSRSWTRIDNGSFAAGGPPIGLVSGPAGLVAVAASGEVSFSPDGETWTKTTLPGMAGREVTGIAASERGYAVAVRNGTRDGGKPNAGVELLTSTDAVSWSSATVTTDTWAWVRVYALNAGFVAIGGVFESPDGPPSNALANRAWLWEAASTWHPMSVPSNFEVDGSTGQLLIGHEHQVFGSDGSGNPLVLYQSEDGETWQPLPVASSGPSVHAPLIVAAHGVFFHPGFFPGPLLYYEAVVR